MAQIENITSLGRTIDRTGWPSGDWDNEDDSYEFESHGLQCRVQRHRWLGHLCGYVAAPAGHPLHGKDGAQVDADVNGGISFADKVNRWPGEFPGQLWWFGFDCGHSWDRCPKQDEAYIDPIASYKTVAHVRLYCERLAAFLAGVSAAP